MADAEDKEINPEVFVIDPNSPRGREGRRLRPVAVKVDEDELAARIAIQEAQIAEVKRLAALRDEATQKATEDAAKKQKEKMLADFAKSAGGRSSAFMDAIKKRMLEEK